jgi:hypothetical protein
MYSAPHVDKFRASRSLLKLLQEIVHLHPLKELQRPSRDESASPVLPDLSFTSPPVPFTSTPITSISTTLTESRNTDNLSLNHYSDFFPDVYQNPYPCKKSYTELSSVDSGGAFQPRSWQ